LQSARSAFRGRPRAVQDRGWIARGGGELRESRLDQRRQSLIREFKPEGLFRVHPRERIVLIGSRIRRFTNPLINQPDVLPEVCTLDVGKWFNSRRFDPDPKLLPEFTGQCVRHFLALSDVTAREVPPIWIPVTLRRAVTEQNTTVPADKPNRKPVLSAAAGVGHLAIIPEISTQISGGGAGEALAP
jgi:hypothetical protein